MEVIEHLCLGCGICTLSCPRDAISLSEGQAKINQYRCNSCGLCRDACPQGAIVQRNPVSREALVDKVACLRQRTSDLLQKIDRLRL